MGLHAALHVFQGQRSHARKAWSGRLSKEQTYRLTCFLKGVPGETQGMGGAMPLACMSSSQQLSQIQRSGYAPQFNRTRMTPKTSWSRPCAPVQRHAIVFPQVGETDPFMQSN